MLQLEGADHDVDMLITHGQMVQVAFAEFGPRRKKSPAPPRSTAAATLAFTLLGLDELGYMQLDRRGAGLLFQVLTEREERSAIAIAGNEPFSGWTKTFTDPRLCAAIVDRLTFAGQIIETGTTSYRLAHARQRRADGRIRK